MEFWLYLLVQQNTAYELLMPNTLFECDTMCEEHLACGAATFSKCQQEKARDKYKQLVQQKLLAKQSSKHVYSFSVLDSKSSKSINAALLFHIFLTFI